MGCVAIRAVDAGFVSVPVAVVAAGMMSCIGGLQLRPQLSDQRKVPNFWCLTTS
jgi:hypothetical protein